MHLLTIIVFSFLSSIPKIDVYLTKQIYNLSFHNFSKLFSIYVIYFNILIRILLLFFSNQIKFIFINLFIELVVINFCLKRCLDRQRPKDSLFLNNKLNLLEYNFVYKLKISNNWELNQSFVSGHVATITLTWLYIRTFVDLYFSYFYYIIILLTFFSRINIGEHYFSDCIISFSICYSFYHVILPLFLINNR